MIQQGNLRRFDDTTFDLVLAALPFDNIPTMADKVGTLQEIGRVLKRGGVTVLAVGTPEVHIHEWVSFSTKDFPENQSARSGDIMRALITDISHRPVVEDILWTDESYQETFRRTSLRLVHTRKPLAREDDPYQCDWINETTIAPVAIYVLQKE